MSRSMRMTVGRAFALAAVVLATYLLWGTWATYPVQLFVVFVHESGHAIVTILSGGEVEGMTINRWLGGSTYSRGGAPFFVLQAGYLASALFGAAMILAAARPKTARGSLGGLAALTAVCGLAFARPIFGLAFPFAMLAAGLIGWAAWSGSDAVVRWLLVYLATVSSLYVLVDIREDLLHWTSGGHVTDAVLLERRTMIPALLWGLGWALAALALLVVALQRAFRIRL